MSFSESLSDFSVSNLTVSLVLPQSMIDLSKLKWKKGTKRKTVIFKIESGHWAGI